MADPTGVKGLDEILRNLNREIEKIKKRTIQGLVHAQVQVRRDMDLVTPKIPVDTGNLRSSYFTVTSSRMIAAGSSPVFDDRDKRAARMSSEHSGAIGEYMSKAAATGFPFLYMGFSAFYALFVHEMVGANFQRGGAGAKFFETAFKNNRDVILRIIAEEAKIK